jgi:hypothetical protein
MWIIVAHCRVRLIGNGSHWPQIYATIVFPLSQALHSAHSCTAAKSISCAAKIGTLVLIEAMHLLPQSFDFRRPIPPPKGRLSEQRRFSSQPLFGSFRKACRTSSRGRLFRLGDWLMKPGIELLFLPVFFAVERRKGDLRPSERKTEASRVSAISRIMSISKIDAVNRRPAPC